MRFGASNRRLMTMTGTILPVRELFLIMLLWCRHWQTGILPDIAVVLRHHCLETDERNAARIALMSAKMVMVDIHRLQRCSSAERLCCKVESAASAIEIIVFSP